MLLCKEWGLVPRELVKEYVDMLLVYVNQHQPCAVR
jgi:hypothetical protein